MTGRVDNHSGTAARMPLFEWYWATIAGIAFVLALCGVGDATPLTAGFLGVAFGWFACAALYETDRYRHRSSEPPANGPLSPPSNHELGRRDDAT